MTTLRPIDVNALLAQAGGDALVYLIGAGGCGMSGLGHLLLDLGHRVSGSDLLLNQEICQLRERGAEIYIGHAEEQITSAHPVLAVYSSAIRSDNPELRAAQQQHLSIV